MYSINPANPLPRRIEQKITYMICCKKYSPPFHNIMTIKSIKEHTSIFTNGNFPMYTR